MAYFEWYPTYSVENAKIDEQHRRLVGYLNELYEAMSAGKGGDALQKILSGLFLYTRTHFADEEALMAKAGYPDLEKHREKHRKMTEQVTSLNTAYRNGEVSSPMQISNFLKNWLMKHILETDKKYAPFLKRLDTH